MTKCINFFKRVVVEVLLDAGVDVNTRTSAGTAMHEAALCGKMEVVRALLDRGVDLAIRDSRKNTVLDLLGQFPPHVTQDITAVIKSWFSHCISCCKKIYFIVIKNFCWYFIFSGHRSLSGIESDLENENLPPIPVQGSDSLGSPYENVYPGDDFSPGDGCSPTRWQFYHKPRDNNRPISDTSVMSLWVNSYTFQQLKNSLNNLQAINTLSYENTRNTTITRNPSPVN